MRRVAGPVHCPVNRLMWTVSISRRFGDFMLDSTQDRPLYRQLTDRLRREVARRRPATASPVNPNSRKASASAASPSPKPSRRWSMKAWWFAARARAPLSRCRPFNAHQSICAASPNRSKPAGATRPVNSWISRRCSGAPVCPMTRRAVDPDRAPASCGRNADGDSSLGSLGIPRPPKSALTRAKAGDPRFSLYRFYEQIGFRIERGVESLSARKPERPSVGISALVPTASSWW